MQERPGVSEQVLEPLRRAASVGGLSVEALEYLDRADAVEADVTSLPDEREQPEAVRLTATRMPSDEPQLARMLPGHLAGKTPRRRLKHAVLFVADLDRSLDFYTGVFGMDVVAR